MKPRGCLIALEGLDGSGTTTQAELLAKRLNKESLCIARLTCEPSQGPIGVLLRQALSGQQRLEAGVMALLFAADRLHHVSAELGPALESGQHVVTDRYIHSSLAYQSVELSPEWVSQINERAPTPDLTVYLRVSAETAEIRRRARHRVREIYEVQAFQQQIAQRYDNLLGDGPRAGTWQLGGVGRWERTGPLYECLGRSVETAVLDGELPVEEVRVQLESLVETWLEGVHIR